MRLLRIGSSNDFAGHIPEDQRGWAIAARMLEEAIGEPVETVLKRSWPSADFPGVVARWIEDLAPDLVVIQVNNFWYGHESVLLWWERKFGRAGERVTKLGLRVGKSPLLNDNRWGLRFNRWLLRVLPGATHFTVPQVAASMEATLRRVLVHEGVVVLVRGNEHWEKLPMADARHNRRNAARNQAMSRAMRTVCDRLHVPYYERPPVGPKELEQILGQARWHYSIEGERLAGLYDGEAMVSVWREARTDVAVKR